MRSITPRSKRCVNSIRLPVTENVDRVHGDVRVNRQIVGFKKLKFYTGENVGAGQLTMPEQEMHTTAFWLHLEPAFLAAMPQYTPVEKQNGLTGLGNAFRTIASLLLMCDPRDLGLSVTEDASGLVSVRQLLGRGGLSAPLYRLSDRLFAQTKELIAGCGCEGGCPACVGPVGEIGEKGKEVASEILKRLIVVDAGQREIAADAVEPANGLPAGKVA